MKDYVGVAGTAIGALIAFLGVWLTQRRTDIRETAKWARERADRDRSEQLAHLIAFLQVAQEAERVAVYLYQHGKDEVRQAVDTTLDKLWVSVRSVQLVCSDEVARATYDFAMSVHSVVRKGPGDQSVRDYLHDERANLIRIGRLDLKFASD